MLRLLWSFYKEEIASDIVLQGVNISEKSTDSGALDGDSQIILVI